MIVLLPEGTADGYYCAERILSVVHVPPSLNLDETEQTRVAPVVVSDDLRTNTR